VLIDFPIALAAMSGYSDWPTRVVARRMGAGYTIGEALLDRFVVDVSKGRKARRYLRVTDDDHPAGAQLMGSTGEQLGPAARRLVEAGFDVIALDPLGQPLAKSGLRADLVREDLNFGCPVKKVVGKCRGGYLLGQPREAVEIVSRVRDAVPPHVPVTVKLRRGMDDSSESRDAFDAILEGVFARGAAAVTVHGRTVRQRYDGRSSWDFLREVKQRLGRRIVFGSGDLFTAQDCLAMLDQTGVDGLTIARGAIGNPWIFGELRALLSGTSVPTPPSVAQQREALVAHYRLAESLYGPKRAGFVMCKYGIKYARVHPRPIEVRDAFAAARNAEHWWAVLDRWYGASGPYP
jgi:nifR3 family TIM-barrel protein